MKGATLHEIDGLKFWAREGTNDFSTQHACTTEDEYGLADVDVKDKLVFDVGAYIGSVGVWLATRGARVVCVEPVPPNAEMIRRNAAANEVEVEVEQVAAGLDGQQIVRWGFSPDVDWNGRVARDPSLGEPHTDQYRTSISHHRFVGDTRRDAPDDQYFRSAVVPSVSFTTLAERHGVPNIIKLDCEGAEWLWLLEPLISKVELLVGEWHQPSTTRTRSRDNLCGILSTHDWEFTGYEAGPGGFTARRR